MRIEALTIHGFKSFPERTRIELKDGITAIVGPNGSGKSNISEAIRWVLGEQSAKSLRGDSMQDIIFNGTEIRKRMGFAEVSLDFADYDGVGDGGQLTITRRYYRSGDSEYLINGQVVRLKDINELFADTGIGKRGYSVISQGRVDELLNEQGSERRKVFDEACGIVKLKLRRREAIKRLEESSANLLRSTDTLRILEEQNAPLQKAAEKLKKFRILDDRLRELDLGLALRQVVRRETEIAEVEIQIADLERNQEELSSELLSAEREFELLEKQREELEEKIEALRRKDLLDRANEAEIRERIIKCEAQIELKEQKTQDFKEQIKKLGSRQGEKRVFDSEAFASIKTAYDALLEEQEVRSTELQEQRDKELALDFELSQLRQKIAETNREHLLLIQEKSALDGKLLAEEKAAESRKEARELLAKELDRLSAEEESIGEKLGVLTKAKLEAEERLQFARAKELQIEEACEAEKEAIKDCKLELREVEMRLAVLENAEAQLEGYRPAYRNLMKSEAREPGLTAGLIGPLGRLLDVEKTYQEAIERALGAALHNLVCESSRDAARMIEWLKRERAGRESFLPLDHFTSRGRRELTRAQQTRNGVLGLACDFVKVEPKYQDIVEDFLGNILLLEDLDSALAMQRSGERQLRMVTLDGELLYPSGTISGGRDAKRGWDLLSRKNAITEAKTQIEELSLEIDSRLRELAATEEGRKQRSDQLAEEEEKILKTAREEIILNSQITDLQGQKKALQGQIPKQEDTDLANLIDRKNNLISQIDLLKETAKENEAAVPKLENSHLAQQKIIKEINDEYSQAAIKVAELRAEYQRLSDIREAEEKAAQEIEHELKLSDEQIFKLGQEIDSLQSELVSNREKLLEISAQRKSDEEGVSNLEIELKAISEKREQGYKLLNQSRESRSALEVEKAKIEGKLEKYLEFLQLEKARIWQEYELSWQELKETAKELDISEREAKSEIARLRSEIRQLGSINASAIDDYTKLSERLEFLKAQHADIEKGQRELERFLSELDREIIDRFKHEFIELQNAFQDVFSELFQGGRAMLRLTDPEALDSAIEIEAQPPGKKLQNLSLLSGGERALTAIAILFALFKRRPAPFAILDEVESALDESNIDRFTAYLKRYSENTQFVLITHRKRTMEVAERLYGISMQERGVSTLLSLEPGSVEKVEYLD